MTTLILHGILGKAGENWGQWLHDELVSRGHNVIMPSLSNPDRPNRKDWLQEIKDLVQDIDTQELTIVAHSLGVASALDFVETIDTNLHNLVCVSGFAIPYGLELNEYFMKEKAINFNVVNPHIDNSSVLYGDNDPYVTQEALQDLADSLNTEPIIIKDGGHLNSNAGFDTFPTLLDCCLKPGQR